MAQLYVTSISRSIIKIFVQNSKIKYLFLLFVIISFHGKSQYNNKVINDTLYFKFDTKYFVSIKNEKKSYIINDPIISKKGSSENVILITLKNTLSGNSIIPILFSDYIRKNKKEINNAYYKKYNRFENLSSSDINLNSLIVYFENKKVFLISNHSQVYEVQFVLQIDD